MLMYVILGFIGMVHSITTRSDKRQTIDIFDENDCTRLHLSGNHSDYNLQGGQLVLIGARLLFENVAWTKYNRCFWHKAGATRIQVSLPASYETAD
jgi:hypothetical protein